MLTVVNDTRRFREARARSVIAHPPRRAASIISRLESLEKKFPLPGHEPHNPRRQIRLRSIRREGGHLSAVTPDFSWRLRGGTGQNQSEVGFSNSFTVASTSS